jgi:hypothetical protein
MSRSLHPIKITSLKVTSNRSVGGRSVQSTSLQSKIGSIEIDSMKIDSIRISSLRISSIKDPSIKFGQGQFHEDQVNQDPFDEHRFNQDRWAPAQSRSIHSRSVQSSSVQPTSVRSDQIDICSTKVSSIETDSMMIDSIRISSIKDMFNEHRFNPNYFTKHRRRTRSCHFSRWPTIVNMGRPLLRIQILNSYTKYVPLPSSSPPTRYGAFDTISIQTMGSPSEQDAQLSRCHTESIRPIPSRLISRDCRRLNHGARLAGDAIWLVLSGALGSTNPDWSMNRMMMEMMEMVDMRFGMSEWVGEFR